MNTNSFNNVALFIKRAEENQTKDFIINAFESNNIGKVKDIKLIKKHNEFGKSYNGVIVIFERWNMNKLVQRLFIEMSCSADGTTKFYFDSNHYWIINVHRQKLKECEEPILVEPSLPDKEKIFKLEELVKSMSAQIYYIQKNKEQFERLIMDLEQQETHHQIVNMELRSQLEEKDRDSRWAEEKLYKEIENIRKENEYLRSRLAYKEEDIVSKHIQIEKLQEELNDVNCILYYVENKYEEMKEV